MKVAVIGVGSAGIITLSKLCASLLDKGDEVYSIYNPKIPILGVGETTPPAIARNFSRGLGFDFLKDAGVMDSTIKHGVKFQDWGTKGDFFHAFSAEQVSLHFNNFTLKDFAFKRLKERWPKKFKVITGNVDKLSNTNDGKKAEVVVNGKTHLFDAVFDCRGYPKDLNGYETFDAVSVNSAMIHLKKEPGDWRFTYHIARKHGWVFGIPLKSRQAWGYVYNNKISTQEEVLEDFKVATKNKKLELKKLIHFEFKSYFSKQLIDGRIIKNGNNAFFVDALQALNSAIYDIIADWAVDYMKGGFQKERMQFFNDYFVNFSREVEEMICYHYMNGSKFDTKFWRQAKATSKARVLQSLKLPEAIRLLKPQSLEAVQAQFTIMGTNGTWAWGGFDPHSVKMLDKELGINILNK